MGRRPVGTTNTKAKLVKGKDAARGGGESSSSTVTGKKLRSSLATNTVLTAAVAEPNHQSNTAAADTEGARSTPHTNGGGSGKNNPLVGLLSYASDSEDDEETLEEAASTPSTAPKTGEASAELPAGWQQCMDSAGLVYFWNTETGETTWDNPGRVTGVQEMKQTPAASVELAVITPTNTMETAASEAPSEGNPMGTLTQGDIVSDATSDTASEPDEDQEDSPRVSPTVLIPPAVPAQQLMDIETTEHDVNAAGAGAGARGSHTVKDKTDSEGGSSRNSCSSANNLNLTSAEDEVSAKAATTKNDRLKDDLAAGDDQRVKPQETAEDGEIQEEGNIPAGVATAAAVAPEGLDDLFAGIEAEILSGGGGDGKIGGNGDNERADAIPILEEFDFSALAKMSDAGLEARAQKAYLNLQLLLSSALQKTAAGDGVDEAGGREADDENKRASIILEMRAVLQARLSDWQQGETGRACRTYVICLILKFEPKRMVLVVAQKTA